jgi:uncharacterized protein (TIGR02145 family)
MMKKMKKLIRFSVLVLFEILVINGCKKENNSPSSPYNGKTTAVFNPSVTYGNMTDQDGNIYKTVTIGTQTWMAENLRTTKYNDGTSIPNVTSSSEWTDLTTGAYCNYNNTTNTDTIATYGRLFNWYAVNTGKLAPKGWHVPTNADWTTLTNYLGGQALAGNKLKETDTTHWCSPNSWSTNETGFTALPGGGLYDYGFDYIGYVGDWWTATEITTGYAWRWEIGYNISYVFSNSPPNLRGFSVRCVKDK